MRPASRETSARMWLAMKTVTPSSWARSRRSSRISTMPAGSRAIGRLVQDKQLRIVQQRLRQTESLGIAMREIAGAPAGIRCQPQTLDDTAHGRRLDAGMQPARYFQILIHSQLRVGAWYAHQISH